MDMKDINRRERLCAIYNEIFNSIRPREYDGQHIRFEGMNPEIALRPPSGGCHRPCPLRWEYPAGS